MRKVIVGAVAGLVVGLAIPSGAESEEPSREIRSLRQRVGKISNRLNDIETVLNPLLGQVATLNQKTVKLQGDGLYVGDILSDQVVSANCPHGFDAAWIEPVDEKGTIRLIGCHSHHTHSP